jgi:hypothetical protein
MSFGSGYGRRRPGGALEVLAALVQGVGGYAQGRQQRQVYQDHRKDQEEARAFRQQQQQWAGEDRQRAIRGEEAAGVERMAAVDPDNALRYLALGTAKRRGVEPPAPVPAMPVFGGLGSGLASRLQQQGLQQGADTQFLTGVSGVQPGRTPAQIAEQQRIATFLRERAAKVADDEREFERQKKLKEYENTLSQPDKARDALLKIAPEYGGAAATNFLRPQFPAGTFGDPSTPDRVIPGAQPERPLEPVAPAGDDLLQRLRLGLQGRTPATGLLGGLNLPEPDRLVPGVANPLEELPISPRTQAALDAAEAQRLAAGETLETTRENRRIAGAKERREAEAFPTIQQGREADVEYKRAQAANARLMPMIKAAEMALRDKSINQQGAIANSRLGLDAMAQDIQRQRLEWERTKNSGAWTDAQKAQAEWLQKNAGARYQAAQRAMEDGGAGPAEAAKAMKEYQDLSTRLEGLMGDPKAAIHSKFTRFKELNGREPTQAEKNQISRLYRSRNGIK